MMQKGFVDIHSHILPGLDDGAKSMDEAVEMVRMASEAGVSVIVATPHAGVRNLHLRAADSAAALTKLKSALSSAGIDMELYLGSEIFCNMDTINPIIDHIKNGDINTINGTKYVMIEMPYEITYDEMFAIIRTYTQYRYKPIIAHVERYACLGYNVERIEELINQGVYIQINASSLDKSFLSHSYRWCKDLLKYNLVHFISSDCHSIEGRPPLTEKEIEKITKLIGEDRLKKLLIDNPRKLLSGEQI